MNISTLLKIFLWVGALFFLFEAPLHFFGLELLEHDKIFIGTHDRYIALFALTYGVLLILCSLNVKKYFNFLLVTLMGIGLAIANATYIAFSGGYEKTFATESLDESVGIMGWSAYVWYVATWVLVLVYKRRG